MRRGTCSRDGSQWRRDQCGFRLHFLALVDTLRVAARQPRCRLCRKVVSKGAAAQGPIFEYSNLLLRLKLSACLRAIDGTGKKGKKLRLRLNSEAVLAKLANNR